MWKYVIIYHDPSQSGSRSGVVVNYQCHLSPIKLVGVTKDNAIRGYALSQGLNPDHVIGALEATPDVYIKVATDGSTFLFTTQKVEGQ